MKYGTETQITSARSEASGVENAKVQTKRESNLAIVNLSSGFWDQDLDYKSNHFTTRSASIMPPIR